MHRLLIAACLLATAPAAQAQVTTNDQALQALKPVPGTLPPATGELAPKPARRPVHRPVVRHTPAHSKPAAPLPAVPVAPPANPVIAPPPPLLPQHPKPVPPPVPVKPDAAGTAAEIPGGTRLTFGPGSSVLNPGTEAALRAIAAKALADPSLEVSVLAWAPGSPDDPSVPRTLALERALAARAVLINAGIVSDRILAVAKGLVDIGAGPPDRVDVTVTPARSTPQGHPLPPPAPVSAHH